MYPNQNEKNTLIFDRSGFWKTSHLCSKIDLHFQDVKFGVCNFDPSHINNNQYLMEFLREEIRAGQGF